MIKFLFKLNVIEKFLKEILFSWTHHMTDKLIASAIAKVRRKLENPDEAFLTALEADLKLESQRTECFGGYSIIRAGLLQSKWRFWVSGIGTSALSVVNAAIGYGSFSNPMTYMTPITSAALIWISSTVIGLPIGYVGRIKGGIKDKVRTHLAALELENGLTSTHARIAIALPARDEPDAQRTTLLIAMDADDNREQKKHAEQDAVMDTRKPLLPTQKCR